MRFKKLSCIPLAACMIAAPSITLAAEACIAGPPTPASYTWNFHQEANHTFQDFQWDAHHALDHAAKLQMFADDEQLSWQTQADELVQLKAEINHMGSRLCRLETIRRVLAPWQQKTVDKIAASLQLMADNAQDAILFGDSAPHELWMPKYRTYADNLYHDSKALSQSLDEAVRYSHVLQESRSLRKELGVKSSS